MKIRRYVILLTALAMTSMSAFAGEIKTRDVAITAGVSAGGVILGTIGAFNTKRKMPYRGELVDEIRFRASRNEQNLIESKADPAAIHAMFDRVRRRQAYLVDINIRHRNVLRRGAMVTPIESSIPTIQADLATELHEPLSKKIARRIKYTWPHYAMNTDPNINQTLESVVEFRRRPIVPANFKPYRIWPMLWGAALVAGGIGYFIWKARS